MAPAMTAVGNAGIALSNWIGVLDQLTKLYEKLSPTPVPPVYCKMCKIDIAFRDYAEHWEIHKKNIIAKEEELDFETTTECIYKKCKRQIPISIYDKHIRMHVVSDKAHLRSTNLEAAELTRAQKTDDISKGYVLITKASSATRNKE